MFTYRIQTKDLNEYGTLYGGQLLYWIDNYCFAKSEDYIKKKGEYFVTRAVNCEFLNPVNLGDTIRITIEKEKKGKTSLTYDYVVKVKKKVIAKGTVTFVKMFKGNKAKI